MLARCSWTSLSLQPSDCDGKTFLLKCREGNLRFPGDFSVNRTNWPKFGSLPSKTGYLLDGRPTTLPATDVRLSGVPRSPLAPRQLTQITGWSRDNEELLQRATNAVRSSCHYPTRRRYLGRNFAESLCTLAWLLAVNSKEQCVDRGCLATFKETFNCRAVSPKIIQKEW